MSDQTYTPTPDEAAIDAYLAEQESTYGIMAEFADVAQLFAAAEACRDKGFKHWDVYAPVPIHGMDEAMGLKPSKVSFAMGMAALTGCTGALLMQWWMGAIDYEIVVGGKPLFAWEQATPITFELSVLLGAFGALGGMFLLNKLPMWYHPLLKKDRFLRVSDDRLIIAVEAADPLYDAEETAAFLASLGGTNIELVEA
jgi:hypothetical protein